MFAIEGITRLFDTLIEDCDRTKKVLNEYVLQLSACMGGFFPKEFSFNSLSALPEITFFCFQFRFFWQGLQHSTWGRGVYIDNVPFVS